MTEVTKYMFDKSGNVVLQQDELGKKGIDLQTQNFLTQNTEYYKQFKYDDHGRLVQQAVVAYDP